MINNLQVLIFFQAFKVMRQENENDQFYHEVSSLIIICSVC